MVDRNMSDPQMANFYNKEWGDLPEINVDNSQGGLPESTSFFDEWGLSSSSEMYNAMQIERSDMSLFGQYPSLVSKLE